MLRIWGRGTSSNVQKVRWLLEEAGIAHERMEVGGPFGGTRTPEYLAMNPNALVPTLQDGDFSLWESHTIVRYLANRHALHAWYPTDWQARADVERWMDWSQSVLGPAIFGGFWGLIRTAPTDRDPVAIRASGDKTGAALAILEARLADRPWLCGAHPTLAEITLGMHVYRWRELPWSQVGHLPGALPRLADWFERLAQRPAFQRVVMITIV